MVAATSGTLSLSGGANSILGGTLSATSPGIVNLAGGTWTDSGGTASGTGVNRFNGGTLNLRTNIIPGLLLTGGEVFVTGTTTFQQAGAITALTLDGAKLKGTSRVGGGVLTVNNGGLEGHLTVESGGQLLLATAATKLVHWLTLINQGTVTWSGGTLNGGSTPTTVISNGGLWQITGDNVFQNGYGGPTMTWTNGGTISKSGGSGTTTINDFNLVNLPSGVVAATSGTLSLPSGYVNTAGTLRLTGGRITATGLRFDGGLLEGTGSYGGNTFLGGTISPGANGPGRIAFTAGLFLASPVVVQIEAYGTAPVTGHDQLAVTGVVGITNSVLKVSTPGAIPLGVNLLVITNDLVDAIVGTFAGKPEGALFAENFQLFRARYSQGTGNDMAVALEDGGGQLTGMRMNAGSFELRGLGTNGALYSIYASQAVPTNAWYFIGNTTADGGGNFLFTDPNAFQFPKRFYQAVRP